MKLELLNFKCGRHLGHANKGDVNCMLNTFNKYYTLTEQSMVCTACHKGKSHQLPLSLSSNKSSEILEGIHIDVWRPSPMLSFIGFRWYVVFIDESSRLTWIYFLETKSRV